MDSCDKYIMYINDKLSIIWNMNQIGLKLILDDTIYYSWTDLSSKIPTESKKYYRPFCMLLEALSFHKEFQAHILKIRQKYGIKVMSIDQWYEYAIKNHDKFQDLCERLRSESDDLKKSFLLDQRLINYISHIVMYGYVALSREIEYPEITLHLSHLTLDRRMSIWIHHPVTKGAIIDFINTNWDEIEEGMNTLAPLASPRLTTKDLRILVLRDRDNKSFNQIAKCLIEEFEIDNYDGKINENSVKMNYHRAIQKIHDAFSLETDVVR